MIQPRCPLKLVLIEDMNDLFKIDEFLTAQLLGDVNYRLPSIVDAITYTKAGVNTYLYYQGTSQQFLKALLQA